MPLSHASESIAPKRALLKLPGWLERDGEAQATHEDFSAKIVVGSSLTKVIEEQFGPHGITPDDVAFLITGHTPQNATHFTDGGVDWSPLLRAIVSGELDADRMDYLLRDSFYTGVQYGRYDLDWIVSNLNPAVKDGRAYLALSRAAAFAFEDFLLSRYHMFVSVYLHHTSVNFDHMLQAFYEEAKGEFEVPADPEQFLFCDDVALQVALRKSLRKSQNRWAQRIVSRQGFKLVLSFTERDRDYDLEQLKATLRSSGIEHFSVTSRTTLSRYSDKGGPSLFIVDVSTGRLTEVAKYTPLYQRYAGAVELSRLYVRPDQADAARAVLHQA
jgi:HD superfamily phosphohydrolase